MSDIYIDTSALAKWYVNEARSDELEAYVRAHAPVAISSLTVVEMRSLLARLRRERAIGARMEMRAFATFEQDVRDGHLLVKRFTDETFTAACNVISVVSDLPVRSLDALHLAVARQIQAATVVTADTIMADAAEALDLQVVWFGSAARRKRAPRSPAR